MPFLTDPYYASLNAPLLRGRRAAPVGRLHGVPVSMHAPAQGATVCSLTNRQILDTRGQAAPRWTPPANSAVFWGRSDHRLTNTIVLKRLLPFCIQAEFDLCAIGAPWIPGHLGHAVFRAHEDHFHPCLPGPWPISCSHRPLPQVVAHALR